jgi:hypothetical protein
VQKTDARGIVYTAGNFHNYGNTIWVDEWQLQYSVSHTEFLMNIDSNGSVSFPQERSPIVTITATISGHFITPSNSLGFANYVTPRSPQNPSPHQPNKSVIGIVNAVFANPKCADFLKTILNQASTKGNPVLYDGDISKIFSDFLAQRRGGVIRGALPGARYGTASGRIESGGKGNGVIYRRNAAPGADQDEYDASGIVNELPHLAGSRGGYPHRNEYDDLSLARATFNSGYDKYFRFFSVSNPFSTYPDKKSQERNRYSNIWSSYFHDILSQHCPFP